MALCKFAGAMFKLYKSRSKFTVKVICLKYMVSLDRYGHKEHKCHIWTHFSYSKRVMSKVTVNVTRLKFMVQSIGKALSWGTHLPNMKALPLRTNQFWQMLKFLKVGQRSRSRSYVHNVCYCRKGLVTRITHAKYESLFSEDIKKIWPLLKIFKSRSWSRSHVQNVWYCRRALS